MLEVQSVGIPWEISTGTVPAVVLGNSQVVAEPSLSQRPHTGSRT